MKKKIVTVTACVLLTFCFSGIGSAASEESANSYETLQKEIDKLNSDLNQYKNAQAKKQEKVKMSGEVRFRYRNFNFNGNYPTNVMEDFRVRLNFMADINPNMKVVTRLQVNENPLVSDGTAGGDLGQKPFGLNMLYVEQTEKNFVAKVGRFSYMSAYGLVANPDDYLDVVQLTYKPSNNLTFLGWYGREDLYLAMSLTDKSAMMSGMEVDWKVSPKTTAKLSGLRYHNTTEAIRFYELGSDYKFNQDWKIWGALTDSSAATENHAQYIRLEYKTVNPKIPHSYNLYGGYQNIESRGTWYTSGDFDACNGYVNAAQTALTGGMNNVNRDGAKGWFAGVHYVPATNVLLSTWGGKYHATKSGDENKKGSFLRAQASLYF